jgi:hypothetical protein
VPLSRKNPSQKRAGRVAQGVSPEFKQTKKKLKFLIYVKNIFASMKEKYLLYVII